MAEATDNSTNLKLVVVTPEATALDVATEFVTVPLFDGELGIGLGHAPLIGRLGFGELRYRAGGETVRRYVDGGFVQVQDNVVSVLTNRALEVGSLDADVAQKQLTEALQRTTSNPEQQAIRDRLISQARAQIRLSGRG